MVEKISEPATPSGLKRWLFRLPLALYSLGLGWVLGARFVLLEHQGRVSGKTRRAMLEVVKSEPAAGVYFVVSAWGERADWFQNIRANPQVEYQVGRGRFEGAAQVLPGEEAGEVFVEYGERNPRMLRELMRIVGFRIEAEESAYRELGDYLPVVKLAPQ
jgi:deazaflavin-dependent oxidoreductase (nitroreductase family)